MTSQFRTGTRLAVVFAGVALMLTGCSAASLPSAAPAKFPGDWRTLAQWSADNDGQEAQNAEVSRNDNETDAEQLSADYDGADALAETYVLGNYDSVISLRAVTAQSPTYFVPSRLSDIPDGASSAHTEVQEFGSTVCRVQLSTGADTECMRSDTGLTVWAGPAAVPAEDIAALVDAAWEEFGGGAGSADWPTEAGSEISIVAPATLGDGLEQGGTVAPAQATRERLAGYAEADAQMLSEIYGGVAATASSYLDQDTGDYLELTAVRAATPPTYVRYEDAARMEILVSRQQRLEFGDVTCHIGYLTIVPADGSRDDLEPIVQSCSRSEIDLTVRIDVIDGDIATSPEAVAALVDAAWPSFIEG